MKAKEEELARKEAELALKEREQSLAEREAALAKASGEPKPKPASVDDDNCSAPKPRSAVWSAQVHGRGGHFVFGAVAGNHHDQECEGRRSCRGQPEFHDLVVDGKVIAKAGALLQGSITEVISGSNKIGGTPTLGLNFDNLMLADGSDTPISASIKQVSAKSDTGRDTAKIAGGALVGA